MKKGFISEKIHCIIKPFENGFNMIFKKRVSRIIASSILCFGVGMVVTTSGVLILNNIDSHKGIGGFETTAIPEYSEDLSLVGSKLRQAVAAREDEEPVENLLESIPEEKTAEAAPATPENTTLTYLTYRVKKGDMIGVIADEFNITQDTIMSINNIKQSRLIQPGQYLKIPSMTGILYTVKKDGETPVTIAEKYEIDANKCALINAMATDTALSAGTALFVPDAELDWATKQEINGDLFKKPLKARYWLSSPFGWRDSPFNSGKRTFHGGIDMAVSSGTPIYPAMDGKVSATGYNATYGNYVIITHHSGYKTLYGHMSSITCKTGNFVYAGTTMIGKVGSTGLSTGPHLHFTVYKNGKSVNPSPLLN